MRQSRTPPWRKSNPRKGRSHKLSPEQREAARERARRAGRHYPNLVDNMRASQRSGGALKSPARMKKTKQAKKKQAKAMRKRTASKRKATR